MEDNVPKPYDFERAIELSQQFGGVALIPVAQLEEIGYVRLEDGNIIPEANVKAVQEKREIKEAILPFGETEFTTIGAEMASGINVLSPREFGKHWGRFIGKIGDRVKVSNLNEAYRDFSKWIDESTALNEVEHRIAKAVVNELKYDFDAVKATRGSGDEFHVLMDYKGRETLGDGLNDLDFYFIFNHNHDKGISYDHRKEIWDNLETVRNVLQDPDQRRDSFDDWQDTLDKYLPYIFHAEVFDEGEITDADKEEFNMSETSSFDYASDIIAKYLTDRGFPVAGELVAATKSSAEALKIMRAQLAKPQDLAELHIEISKLSEEIREAPVEKKRHISQELSELKKEAKSKKQFLTKATSIFGWPEEIAEIYASEIKRFQKTLFVARADASETTVYLDANYDTEKDRDPGKLTGDCTAGNPLPFANSTGLPVFNVKVSIGEASNHVGYIYLVETGDDNSKSWHLEAIQIPDKNISWADFPKALTVHLATLAKAKGVNSITVNTSSHTISNFDYIGDGFLGYIRRNGEPRKVNVEYPEEAYKFVRSGNFSHFQGDGSGYALWHA